MTKVMLYDGSCNLCHHGVQFILENEQDTDIHFASLEGSIGQSFKNSHPELNSLDAVLILNTETSVIHSGSQAVIEISRHLKSPWHLIQLIRFVPLPIRQAVYREVAKSRYRIFGQTESCILPNQETRLRFLDIGQ
ncbi:thiol-disulfide oxidoreductase DCC family protein [Salisediminibacterium beveridgei]|uniref:Thiol-disulfide oxidoreductase DCC n=1 Tax=Salisediminibacterium beveridgei TaxID=632773 RepID=A0A1D7QVF3_9BACI|nr:DCC1-like thiol-disulfide oxidoreductase family protein [Salisediminibacterium beveridgei]AOM82991.1 hypothetical protein BBEV_1630 [Salisediminibacterium beveridgei]